MTDLPVFEEIKIKLIRGFLSNWQREALALKYTSNEINRPSISQNMIK